MVLQEQFYPESRFGGYADTDGTIIFYTRINSLIDIRSTILDVGCGRGAYGTDITMARRNLRIFKGKVSKVIGIDKDPEAQNNPFVDEFRLMRGETWPVDDDEIDLIVCDYVLEHVEKVNVFFYEALRVLKPEGILCLRTPNLWGYPYWLAGIIPKRFHSRIIKFVQTDRPVQEIFQTFYRCNTIGRISRMMRKFSFDSVVYTLEPEPSYLSFSKFAYWLGVFYQRHAPRVFRTTILAFGRIKKTTKVTAARSAPMKNGNASRGGT
jgi:2-polyprenyl-3-methyl-5-hydroxy-6-metoxy-1,4-benzoquinol methylase